MTTHASPPGPALTDPHLATRLRALTVRLWGRLPEATHAEVRACAETGDPGCLFVCLCRALNHAEVVITTRHYTELSRLGQALGVPPGQWDRVRVYA